MAKKFLVAVDGSEHGWKALDLAADLAKHSDAELIILHVMPYEPMPEGLREYAKMEGIPIEEERGRYHAKQAFGDSITDEAKKRAQAAGASRVTTKGAEGHPADQIIWVAEVEDVDMIFVGSRGLSDAKSLLVGSVSHKVMNLAPCTCVAVK